MALTLEASGTQTATIGTEHVLSTLTSFKTFVLTVDANALAAGEILRLRITTTVLSAGTDRQYVTRYFQGVLEDPILISAPIISDISVSFKLTQQNGTGRAFPWKVQSIS